MSLEEAGRMIRYRCFRKVLDMHGGGKIAVAHHQNDQAETMLYRMSRGTGIQGLKGMEAVRADVIRPLSVSYTHLDVYKRQTFIRCVRFKK